MRTGAIPNNGFLLKKVDEGAEGKIDFASREIVQVAGLPAGLRLGSYFAVSRDGRSILYTQNDSWMSDIEMLREFR